jgi:Protein of unknown function DUF262
MEETSLRKEEESTFYEEDRDQPIPPPNVVAYNELRSCADLYRMFTTGKLEIQPDFQREVVWRSDEQARFIDSLVKQLPIPSMCFSLDYKTQKWKVIDGLQRMSTITNFLGTANWKIADIEDIHPSLRNKTNIKLREGSPEEKNIYSSVEDLSIPITVIRCSYEEAGHMRYLFTIFNRLNSGGVRLNNQEIRNCIYSGKFNDLLKTFDKSNKDWAAVKKRIWGPMGRFRSVEVLLRALAFSTNLKDYDGNLAGFLNGFMHRFMKITDENLDELKSKLDFVAMNSKKALDNITPGRKKSLTFVEGILVALLHNDSYIRSIGGHDKDAWLHARASEFSFLPVYVDGARYALSSASTVKDRLTVSIGVFSH